VQKDRIVAELGEEHLLLPVLIREAIRANDRVKYLLSLLQAARLAADGGAPASLREERLACGIDDRHLDALYAQSTALGGGRYRIPGAGALVARCFAELDTMLAPLRASAAAPARSLGRRSRTLAAVALADRDEIGAAALARLTQARSREGGDSLHLVVMDAHRALRALEARVATEVVDGAHAHDLAGGDRELVAAFMRGVHSTERLRLDHPGLDTTATRTGEALVIQNDLGTTDAHVVVIRIEGLRVSVVYTDVHLERLLFFQELLRTWELTWDDTRSRTDRRVGSGLYHLACGRIDCDSAERVSAFLEHLGSRLVFMIDWNRARKRLRRLVGKRTALRLLRWAAENELGHLAFLRAGGDALVYEALEFAASHAIPAGESLVDALGGEAAEECLRAVMRICAEGMLDGRSSSLIRDEVRAELAGWLRSARERVLELAVRHAELCVEIAEAARDAIEQAAAGERRRRKAIAARAARAERQADAVAGRVRAEVSRSPDLGALLELVGAADDIADGAEEAVFYATLLDPGRPAGEAREQLRRMARLVLDSTRDWLRAVQLSAELRRGNARSPRSERQTRRCGPCTPPSPPSAARRTAACSSSRSSPTRWRSRPTR
jgi:hypothetical protein